MPENVYSAAMTLDGSQYLATNDRIMAATRVTEAGMVRLDVLLGALQAAMKPVANQAAVIKTSFDRVTQSTAGLAAATTPANLGLSATARALAGLGGDDTTAGMRQIATALSTIAERAENAGIALEGVGQQAAETSGVTETSEAPEKSEAETSSHPESHSGSGIGVALGAALGGGQQVEGLKEVVAEEKNVEAATERMAEALKGSSTAAEHTAASVSHAAKEEHGAAAAAHHLAEETRDAGIGFRGLGESAAKAGELIRDMLVAVPEVAALVAVFASVEEVVTKVRESFEYGDKLNALSRQTGESAESIARLRRTFEYFDVSADAVGTTLFMLQKSLGGVSEEGEPTAAAFARIGLSIADLKKMDASDQFAAIQKGLQTLPDQATKSAVAMKIFGRSALEVQSILNASPADFAESMAAAADYAEVMGQNADLFEEVERKFFVFRENIETIFARIAAALAPAIDSLLGYVNKVDFAKWGRDLTATVSIVQNLVNAFGSGDLREAFFLALDLAALDATQAMVGYFTAAAVALGKGLAAVFSSGFWESLKEGFLGVADAFGAALLKVLSGPIAEIQAALDYAINKKQASDNYKADKKDYESDSVLVARKQQEYDVWRKMSTQGMGPHEKAAYDKKLADAKAALVGAHNLAGADASRMSKDADMQGMSMEEYVAKNGNQPTLFGRKAGDLDASSKKHFDAANAAGGPIVDQITAAVTEAFNKVNAPGNLLSDAIAATSAKLNAILARYPILTGTGDPKKDGPGIADHTALDYKLPQGDRLSRVGLFVGGSTATPGLTEARRTAAATEGTLRQLQILVPQLAAGGGLNKSIPRYL